MTEYKSFKILHFSRRKWNSYHEQGCYRVNLVFRVWDEDKYSYTKERFMNETLEWQEAEIITNLELEEKYSSGLRMINANTRKDLLDDWRDEAKDDDDYESFPIEFVNDYGIEREQVYTKGYKENWNAMLTYNEKFDVFRFYEYFEINSATEGIIKFIENLKEMRTPDTYYAGQLFRALKSLELWWD